MMEWCWSGAGAHFWTCNGVKMQRHVFCTSLEWSQSGADAVLVWSCCRHAIPYDGGLRGGPACAQPRSQDAADIGSASAAACVPD